MKSQSRQKEVLAARLGTRAMSPARAVGGGHGRRKLRCFGDAVSREREDLASDDALVKARRDNPLQPNQGRPLWMVPICRTFGPLNLLTQNTGKLTRSIRQPVG